MPKYPNINVQLTGRDGNAFSIIGAVTKAMREAGVEESEISSFKSRAMAGDYNQLLRVAMETVKVT